MNMLTLSNRIIQVWSAYLKPCRMVWIKHIWQGVRHEAAQGMRVWPLGAGLQEQAPKHLKLHRLRAVVVSVEEKVLHDGISCESERRAQANHPMRCRK